MTHLAPLSFGLSCCLLACAALLLAHKCQPEPAHLKCLRETGGKAICLEAVRDTVRVWVDTCGGK